jgi:fatty-acyl-CoA synthase
MVSDWLARRAALSPERIALTDTVRGRKITFREWNAAANRTARYLRELGVARGDRVAVLAMNCVEVLDIWFACAKLGAIFQPLNWRLASNELAALVADGMPTVFVYGPNFAAQAEALRANAPSVRHFVPLEGANGFSVRDGHSEGPFAAEAMAPGDPWALCYTGGTTGVPKAAVLTYGSIHANAVNTLVSWGLDANDIAILNAPLFHTGGMNVFTAPLVMAGGASVVCSAFDVDQVFDLVAARAVTVFFGVPTMFIAMQAHKRWSEVDFSSLKLVISGGAPCPSAVFEKFWERGVDFKTGYGLTEAGPNNFWLPPEEVRKRPGAVGVPLFDVAVKLVDEAGRELSGTNQVVEGELLIRGPHVCGGYWNRPADTAKVMVDGWLRTGDLARRDADGFYSIVGRSKDLIISGGENIYPAEVESVLATHPAVAEVALIPVPDPKWGEVPRAVVVLRSGASATDAELIAHAKSQLASYKVPKSVVFVEALPKTGVGKVDKRALATQHGRAG